MTNLTESLAEQHRQRQLALRALIIRQVVAVMPMLDFARLEDSWPRVEQVLIAAVRQGRELSSLLADEYYRQERDAINAPSVVLERPLLDASALAALTTSLQVTGLVEARRLVQQKRPDARNQTLVTLSGSSTRHALAGGRDTLKAYMQMDKYAHGYKRVTSGKACKFCQMLAGRGAVYKKDSGDFKAHDHCGCSLQVVFKR